MVIIELFLLFLFYAIVLNDYNLSDRSGSDPLADKVFDLVPKMEAPKYVFQILGALVLAPAFALTKSKRAFLLGYATIISIGVVASNLTRFPAPCDSPAPSFSLLAASLIFSGLTISSPAFVAATVGLCIALVVTRRAYAASVMVASIVAILIHAQAGDDPHMGRIALGTGALAIATSLARAL